MTELLAVFRSRAQAADCNSRLRINGVPSNLINTPKEAGIGCGLSVKIPQNMATREKGIVMQQHYAAFYGFYAMKTLYGRTFFGRI